jgi:hypothetical protein
MGLADRVWDAFATVVQMRDRIALLTEAVKKQQLKIEDLTERTIRLETTIDLLKQAAFAREASAASNTKRLAK